MVAQLVFSADSSSLNRSRRNGVAPSSLLDSTKNPSPINHVNSLGEVLG